MHWFTVAYGIEPLDELAVDSSMGEADSSDASDTDDPSMGGFISDDGSDWRAQVDWQPTDGEQCVTGMDPHGRWRPSVA